MIVNPEQTRNPKFDALLRQIKELHDGKSHDYSDDADPLSNLRAAQRLGVEPWRGVLIRLSDKWSRLEQLASGKRPKNESLRDTLVDMSIYALLAVLLLDETKG